MIGTDDISRIKQSTVAICLVNKNNKIVSIKGSGVIVDPEGYFITAGHVIEGCKKESQRIMMNETVKTRMAMANYIHAGDAFSFVTNPIAYTVPLSLELSSEGTNINFDITIGILKEKENKHPYLEIGNKARYNVMNEIFMCGYPGGDATLKPTGQITDIAFSPVLQYGRIAALMPGDNAPLHQGIITDIIGTNGSSGSAIINASDLKVIGIAQTVIAPRLFAFSSYKKTSYKMDEQGKLSESESEQRTPVYGNAQIGLVIGVSNALFGDVPKAIEQLKSGATEVSVTGTTARPVDVRSLNKE